MEYFKRGFGLVTKNDPTTENCNLFYAEFLALKAKRLHVLEDSDLENFVLDMTLKLNKKGLYDRRSEEASPIRSVSHDEITGWMVSSRILGTNHGKNIWKHLITHLGSYNNTGRLTEALPFNPANYYAWGELADSWIISKAFFPMYLTNMMISINKDPQETSSKIIYWLELSVMPKTTLNNMLWNIFEKEMKKQYGEKYLHALFEIYFSMEDKDNFPIFKELKGL